jgi:hypothetical protein
MLHRLRHWLHWQPIVVVTEWRGDRLWIGAQCVICGLVTGWHEIKRPLPFDRDQLGRFVREAWVRWARTQPDPKPSWLVPYDELSETDREADRQIGEAVARWTLIGDAAKAP